MVLGLVLLITSLVFYLFSLQRLQIPTLIYISTILTVVSALIYFAGIKVLKEITVPVILLFMLIPIPNQLFSIINSQLPTEYSEISGFIVQLFSLPLLREGNVLRNSR